jgi:aspartyl protease family protein
MIPEPLAAVPPAVWIGIVAVLLLASRVRIIGAAVRIGLTCLLLAMLVLGLTHLARFDPTLARYAAMLNLGEQKVVGRELRIAMAPDGHFWATALVDGVERRLLVDSGATVTALSTETARAARVAPDRSPFPVLLRTANGTIRADTGEVSELRLGNVVARDLPVVVSPALGGTDILGMNFLSRLKSWRVEGRTLVLEPHHPQEIAADG